MLGFLAQNVGTIVIGLVLLGIVGLIIRNMVKRARRGQCVSCDGCDKSSGCHCHTPNSK